MIFFNCLCRFYWGKHCSFPHKTLSIAAIFFLIGFFPFKIIFIGFFFNIKLIKNYNYNKAKSYEKSVVVFLTKHCGLLRYFFKWFFLWFFLNCFCRFYWGKHTSFPHKTLSIATTFFLMGFFPSKIIFVNFFILSW